MSEKDFDELLLEAVDEGLSTIGESSKQAIYFYLEIVFNIKRHEIPYRIEDFVAAIGKIFGLGANCLEILIMKSLSEKVGRTVQLHEPKDFSFTVYVAAAKRGFLKEKETEELTPCDQVVSRG